MRRLILAYALLLTTRAHAADTLVRLTCTADGNTYNIQHFDDLMGGGPAGFAFVPRFAAISKVSNRQYEPTLILAEGEYTYRGDANGNVVFHDAKHDVDFTCRQLPYSPLQ